MRRRTIITLVLALLGIAAAWLDHARSGAAAADATVHRPLLDPDRLPVEEVQRITITRRDEAPLVFERQEDGNWRQIEPIEHAVDLFSMHRMMAVARELVVTGTIEPDADDPATTPGALSLDPPLATIRFDWSGGDLTLDAGRRGLAGRAYVRVEGDPLVYVTGPELSERIVEMDPREWRDRHLFPDASIEAARIELYDGQTPIVLESERKQWSMVEPVATRVDPVALDTLVQSLARVQSAGFLADHPESLAEYGLDEPAGAVAVTTIEVSERDGEVQRTPRTRRLLVGPRIGASQDRFGMVEGADTVFRIRADSLPGLFPRADQLVDPTASGAQAADVKSIHITAGDREWTIERDLDRWYDPSGREEVSVAAVAELLGQLTAVRAPRVRLQPFPRDQQVGLVTLYGYNALPMDTVRIARDDSTGEWALENGDGVLRLLPATVDIKLTPEAYGLR